MASLVAPGHTAFTEKLFQGTMAIDQLENWL